jgi:hypothetical protein
VAGIAPEWIDFRDPKHEPFQNSVESRKRYSPAPAHWAKGSIYLLRLGHICLPSD